MTDTSRNPLKSGGSRSRARLPIGIAVLALCLTACSSSLHLKTDKGSTRPTQTKSDDPENLSNTAATPTTQDSQSDTPVRSGETKTISKDEVTAVISAKVGELKASIKRLSDAILSSSVTYSQAAKVFESLKPLTDPKVIEIKSHATDAQFSSKVVVTLPNPLPSKDLQVAVFYPDEKPQAVLVLIPAKDFPTFSSDPSRAEFETLSGHFVVALITDPSSSLPIEVTVSRNVADLTRKRKPAPVVLDDVAGVTKTSIGLSWKASPGAEAYEVERAVEASDECGPFQVVASVKPPTVGFLDGGLASETAYCYRVRAINNGGAGDFSATKIFTTLEADPVVLNYFAALGGTEIKANGLPTLKLTLTGTRESGATTDLSSTATWASSDLTVATVDATGLVKAQNNGFTTIKAVVGSTETTQSVTVSGANAFCREAALHVAVNLTGAGNSGDPYKVCTLTHLDSIRAYPSASFALKNDIDASATASWDGGAGFTPISGFAGGLTGMDGGTIRSIVGITINRPSMDDVGMFSILQAAANVQSLKLKSFTIAGRSSVGSLAGRSQTALIGGISSFSSVSGDGLVGGLIGAQAGGGTVSNLSFSGDVHSSTSYAGGVFASSDSSISGAQFTGRVTCRSMCSWVGGVVGGTTGFGVGVTRSIALGTVDTVYNSSFVGGIAGWAMGDVSESVSASTVVGESEFGGITGRQTGNVHDTLSVGIVSARAGIGEWCDAGGVVGQSFLGNLTNSYSTAHVTCGDPIPAPVVCCGATGTGGIIGRDGDIANVFFAGKVKGRTTSPTPHTGAISGYNFSGSLNIARWFDDSTGDTCDGQGGFGTNCSGTTDMSTLKNPGNLPMSNWNFATVWTAGTPVGEFPFLQWQGATPQPYLVPDKTIGGRSKELTFSISVSGPNVVNYRYKFGAKATTDCTDLSGYGVSTPRSTGIPIDVSLTSDGDYIVCAIGQNAASTWLDAELATLLLWTKDTVPLPTPPTATVVTGSGAAGTIDYDFVEPAGMLDFTMGVLLQISGATPPTADCETNGSAVRWAHTTGPGTISGLSTGAPYSFRFCLFDAAGNVTSVPIANVLAK